MTLVTLPPYSPELNPVERLWLYLRQHHGSNRVYENLAAVEDAAVAGWRAACLTPDRVKTVCRCEYLPAGSQQLGSALLGQISDHSYSDLARVVDAWPTLPDPIRRAMMALVETAAPACGPAGAGHGLDDAVPPGYEGTACPTGPRPAPRGP